MEDSADAVEAVVAEEDLGAEEVGEEAVVGSRNRAKNHSAPMDFSL